MEPISKNNNFDTYWISYLGFHTDPLNRLCHYVGTTFGIIGGILGFIFINLLAGLVIGIIGYSIALIGHFTFQKNSPHAIKPHLGLICDFLMLYLFNREKLNQQLKRIK